MSAKSLIEIEILRKFEETPHTQKYEKTHWRKKQNGREEVRKPNDCSSRGKPNKHRERKPNRHQCRKKSSIYSGKPIKMARIYWEKIQS